MLSCVDRTLALAGSRWMHGAWRGTASSRRRGTLTWPPAKCRLRPPLGEAAIIPADMAKLPVYELRRLVLPIETAVDAVLELDGEQGGTLTRGTLSGAQIESEPEPGLIVVVQPAGGGAAERRKFTFPILAAAFIRYCWKCRIPLPRHGTKRIEIAPEGFVFTIEGTTEVVRRHGALPQRGPRAATGRTGSSS
jgi:hypothetical protein